MTEQQRKGRASIFRDKDGGGRVQGVLTPRGIGAFNLHRSKLAKLVKREPSKISDADVVESLAIGWGATRAYVKENG